MSFLGGLFSGPGATAITQGMAGFLQGRQQREQQQQQDALTTLKMLDDANFRQAQMRNLQSEADARTYDLAQKKAERMGRFNALEQLDPKHVWHAPTFDESAPYETILPEVQRQVLETGKITAANRGAYADIIADPNKLKIANLPIDPATGKVRTSYDESDPRQYAEEIKGLDERLKEAATATRESTNQAALFKHMDQMEAQREAFQKSQQDTRLSAQGSSKLNSQMAGKVQAYGEMVRIAADLYRKGDALHLTLPQAAMQDVARSGLGIHIPFVGDPGKLAGASEAARLGLEGNPDYLGYETQLDPFVQAHRHATAGARGGSEQSARDMRAAIQLGPVDLRNPMLKGLKDKMVMNFITSARGGLPADAAAAEEAGLSPDDVAILRKHGWTGGGTGGAGGAGGGGAPPAASGGTGDTGFDAWRAKKGY